MMFAKASVSFTVGQTQVFEVFYGNMLLKKTMYEAKIMVFNSHTDKTQTLNSLLL